MAEVLQTQSERTADVREGPAVAMAEALETWNERTAVFAALAVAWPSAPGQAPAHDVQGALVEVAPSRKQIFVQNEPLPPELNAKLPTSATS